MALIDLQTFLQERAAAFDATIDLTSGSPFDREVIQPLLRRLGTDPFSVDMGVFLQDRINQEFPGAATKEGDALTDLLIKMAVVLWDPIVRENFRVRQNMSFKDPTVLTLEEAESLGANLFSERNKGDLSRGVARIYFAQAQQISISPTNFVSAQGGLNFFPTENQSISVDEMLFNTEGGLYYFDVNVVAEKAGDEYNIGPDQLISIANVGAAVRITNKLRFRFGEPAETAVEFIDRSEQDLTERSMVTQRGIIAKVAKAFSEVTRIGITGFNDPEMQRDIITGGGLGGLLAAGVKLQVAPDGENRVTSRRLTIDPSEAVDFAALIGPPGQGIQGFTITVHGAFPVASLPRVRDLRVRAVINATTLDLEEQVLEYGSAFAPWALRKNELTLSGIPGGILFPDTTAGTVAIPPGVVHIGGATDIFVRGSDFDQASLLLDAIVDDEPILQGVTATILNSLGDVQLGDLSLSPGGTPNYSVGDGTYLALEGAIDLSLVLRDAPFAGSYRILSVTQTAGASPVLRVTPPPPAVLLTNTRWRLLDVLDIDLVEPKETKIAGADLVTVQGLDDVTTVSAVDFDTYGVAPDDILRIFSGDLIVGDYTVKQVLSPLFTHLQVDRALPATVTNARFAVFRPNKEGGISLPFIRIDTIDLLDTSNQPIGSTVPYARPIDIRSRSFANAAHGVKADFTDARLGLVGVSIAGGGGGGFNVSTQTLFIQWTGVSFTVTFASGTTTVDSVVNQINAASALQPGGISRLAVKIDGPNFRLALLPVDPAVQVTGGTALTTLFGTGPTPFSATDIRSATVDFSLLRPALDPNFDAVQVLDGLQVGFYDQLVPNGLLLNTAHPFSPELRRHLQVGSRSLGSARLYFLEPTSIEFGPGSIVSSTGLDGAIVRYLPDPTLLYQKIPALPAAVKPKDGVTTGSTTFTSAGTDFIKQGIRAGDQLVIDYKPVAGGVLADPVPLLAFTNVILSINGGNDKAIIFVHDDVTLPLLSDVTRKGVADQINRVVGQTICKINASNQLEFEADASIIIRGTGSANAILGLPPTDTSNDAPAKGKYTISSVTSTTTLLLPVTLPPGTREQFKVFRKGVQRIVSTQMAKQVAGSSLYYFDLELISEGTGDQYNIDADLQMFATGYKSDGYYLTTDDPNLTFSPVEKPRLHISSSILEIGTSDDPNNATQLSGQNLQVNYERSSLTNSVQNFALAETERVICSSPLARHLKPYFVRFDATYVGGGKESDVSTDMATFIKGLFPSDSFEVSDVEQILSNRGARAIDNPIDLIAVVHEFDRSIVAERSKNKLNTGRLAAFIPDIINLTRKVT